MKKEYMKEEELKDIGYLISQDKHKEALNSLKYLKKKYPNDKNLIYNECGILIDIGSISKDQRIISTGIKKGNSILKKKEFDKYKADIHYNLSNGHKYLFDIEKYKRPSSWLNNKNLQNVKKHLRKALKCKPEPDLKVRILTNYGNCLDTLGRNFEALCCYDEALKINPEHSMAMGNKAMAIRFFADISGGYIKEIYIKSYHLLKSALEHEKDLIRVGGITAKKDFENEIKQIEERFNDRSELSKTLKYPKYDSTHMTEFEKFYIPFCSEHNLFLNFHIHESECESSIVDPIFISLITPMDDNETFYNLAKHINEIKEDYAVARLLLVQSQFKREDFNHISKRTTLLNTMDYSIFNIYAGLLKASFRMSYNILDKIAYFINDYLNFGMKDSEIHFHTIWEEQGKVKNKISRTNNISLFALYDMNLDFRSDYKKLSEIRNSVTHRKLTLYDTVLTKWGEKEDNENMGYDVILSETIKLMQIVKSAIIYLINFVEIEENKKRMKSDGNLITFDVDTTQYLY